MTPTPLGALPHLVESLAKVAKRDPVARKLLVAPNIAAGRELLRRYSLARGGWIGFEVTTPRPLALRLAREAMERSGLSASDAFEEQAMLDRALDRALASEGGRLGDLSEGVGFREKVHEAVSALRLAGIGPPQIGRARLADWRKRRFLMRVLERYEGVLAKQGSADTATILRLGVEALEEAGGMPPSLGADAVLLMPGLGTRGLAGRLISELCRRGAKVLETDPVLGLDQPEAMLWNRRRHPAPGSRLFAPGTEASDGGEPTAGQSGERLDIDLFRAGSINDELREVLRRVVRRGLRWDQVEVISPDPAAYGSALHALSTRLAVPATYAVGLPIERTRTGRVVRGYLDWISEGFQAGPIRRLLEAGDLRPRTKNASAPAALARRFRSLRVGWGRKRYRTQIREGLSAVEKLERSKHESEARFERRRTEMLEELRGLQSILFPTLKATPAVPDRMGVGGEPVSPAEIARGLLAFLKRVPKGQGPDRAARDDVGRILERIEATLRRRTEFRAAVAILRGHLEVRVRAEQPGADPDDRGAPWSSEGGAIHLADFEHGGYSGREAVFIVGLDSDRVPGPGGQDPVLLDGDRRVLGGGLPTSTELMQERVFRLAALIARLRGTVTMSFTSWSASEARTSGPSPTLLHALRLARGDATLTFNDLEAALGRVASSIPAPGSLPLDREDVWMSAIGEAGVLRTGVDSVRRAFPRLDSGLTAKDLRVLGTPDSVHGVIRPRPEELDPRRNPSVVVSASGLEALGTCPLRYMHRAVLRIYVPDDPELDPDCWLDPRRRGGLLHSAFEETLQGARDAGVGADESRFEELALDALTRGVERARLLMPVPGEGTFRRETSALQEDMRSFVRMVRQRGAPWIALELTFGLGDDDPLAIAIDDETMQVRGAIDRVDEDLQGVRVVDYKTGSTYQFKGNTGTFHGGRRLQHALYALAADASLGGVVAGGEYHFPTRRGENQVFAFDRLRLAGVGTLIGHMLDGVAEGSFVPTDEAGDCKFCDYAEICRARAGEWGKVDSPLADWSKEHLNTGLDPAHVHLKRARTFES